MERPHYYAYLVAYTFTDTLQHHCHIYFVDSVFLHHIGFTKTDLFIDVLCVVVSKGVGGSDDLGVMLLFEHRQQFPQGSMTVMLILIAAVDGEVPEEEAVALKPGFSS